MHLHLDNLLSHPHHILHHYLYHYQLLFLIRLSHQNMSHKLHLQINMNHYRLLRFRYNYMQWHLDNLLSHHSHIPHHHLHHSQDHLDMYHLIGNKILWLNT